MRNKLILVLAICMLGLVGCGKGTTETTETAQPSDTSTVTTTTTTSAPTEQQPVATTSVPETMQVPAETPAVVPAAPVDQAQVDQAQSVINSGADVVISPTSPAPSSVTPPASTDASDVPAPITPDVMIQTQVQTPAPASPETVVPTTPATDMNANTLPNASPDDVNKAKTAEQVVPSEGAMNNSRSDSGPATTALQQPVDQNNAPAPVDQD